MSVQTPQGTMHIGPIYETGAGVEITIAEAIDVFVRGFSVTRSIIFPYHAEPLQDGVWVMRDADYRNEEYVAYGMEAAALDALAKQQTRGRYRLCVVRRLEDSDMALRAEFKALGYRLMTTEPFIVHRLT